MKMEKAQICLELSEIKQQGLKGIT